MFYRRCRNCCFFRVFTASNCHFAFCKLFNKQFINLYKAHLGIQLSSVMIMALSSKAAAANRDVPSALLPARRSDRYLLFSCSFPRTDPHVRK